MMADRNLLFTNRLLVDVAQVNEELLFGLGHPNAYSIDRAEVATGKFVPEFLYGLPRAMSIHPRASHVKALNRRD
jgi:hypothetical protein